MYVFLLLRSDIDHTVEVTFGIAIFFKSVIIIYKQYSRRIESDRCTGLVGRLRGLKLNSVYRRQNFIVTKSVVRKVKLV